MVCEISVCVYMCGREMLGNGICGKLLVEELIGVTQVCVKKLPSKDVQKLQKVVCVRKLCVTELRVRRSCVCEGVVCDRVVCVKELSVTKLCVCACVCVCVCERVVRDKVVLTSDAGAGGRTRAGVHNINARTSTVICVST